MHPRLLDEPAEIWARLNAELGSECPVKVASSLDSLAQANVILGSSNAPHALIRKASLGEQPTLICDISVPPDVASEVNGLAHVSIIQGGVVRLPDNPDFHPACSPLRPGSCYACLAETLVLALSGLRENYSYGAITRGQVERVARHADEHGFTLDTEALDSPGYNVFSV
jgi:predicted amino acid dehydrogenase